MKLFQALLKSKKLQIALANVMLVIFNDKFGLGIDPATIIEIITISSAYIIAQGFADSGTNKDY